MVIRCAAACAVALAAMASASRGSAESASDKKLAEKLFLDARAALERSDYATACPLLEQSLALVDCPGTRLNLAECATRDGRPVAALTHLERFLATVDIHDERRGFAERRIAELQGRIAKLTIHLDPTLGPSPRVELDGRVLDAGSIDAPVRLDPGRHTIQATGAKTAHAELTLAAGDAIETTIGTPPPPPAPRPVAAPRRSRARTVGAVAAGAVGAIGVGVAATSGVVLISKKQQLDALCKNKVCPPAGQGHAIISDMHGLFVVNGIGWGAAIAGAGAAAGLFLWPSSPSRADVAVTISGTGLGLEGRF